MAIRFRFVNGARAGQEVEFGDAQDRISIGRDPSRCEVVFPTDERGVGREHCGLERVLGRYRFVLNDRNGVWLDGERAHSGQELPARTVLQLGRGGAQLEVVTLGAADLPSTLRGTGEMELSAPASTVLPRNGGVTNGGVRNRDVGPVEQGIRRRRWTDRVALGIVVAAAILGGLAALSGRDLDPGDARAGLADDVRERAVGWVTPTLPDSEFDPENIYDRCHALIIGIDRYEDPSLEPLDHAVSDARAIADLLQGNFGYSAEHVTTLFDEQATRAAILKKLAQLRTQISPDDSFLLFWAGHAIQASDAREGDHGYLVPFDGTEAVDLRSVLNIPMASLHRDELPFLVAKHKLLVVDTCFSGLMRKFRGIESDRNRPRALTPAHLRAIARKPVTYVLTAGDSSQRVLDSSVDGRRRDHSAFAAHLIEILENEVGSYCTASDLGPELRRRVLLDAERQGFVQTPLYGVVDGEGDFIFVRRDPVKTD